MDSDLHFWDTGLSFLTEEVTFWVLYVASNVEIISVLSRELACMCDWWNVGFRQSKVIQLQAVPTPWLLISHRQADYPQWPFTPRLDYLVQCGLYPTDSKAKQSTLAPTKTVGPANLIVHTRMAVLLGNQLASLSRPLNPENHPLRITDTEEGHIFILLPRKTKWWGSTRQLTLSYSTHPLSFSSGFLVLSIKGYTVEKFSECFLHFA